MSIFQNQSSNNQNLPKRRGPSRCSSAISLAGLLLTQSENSLRAQEVESAKPPPPAARATSALASGSIEGPFKARNPATRTRLVPPVTIYLNASGDSPEVARRDAAALADKLNSDLFLLYTGPITSPTNIQASYRSLAEISDKLRVVVENALQRDAEVNIIGYGSGALASTAALSSLEKYWAPLPSAERARRFSKVHLVDIWQSAGMFEEQDGFGIAPPKEVGSRFKLQIASGWQSDFTGQAPVERTPFGQGISRIIPSLDDSILTASGRQMIPLLSEIRFSGPVSAYAAEAMQRLDRARLARAETELIAELNWLESERILQSQIPKIRQEFRSIVQEIDSLNPRLATLQRVQESLAPRIAALETFVVEFKKELEKHADMQAKNVERYRTIRKTVNTISQGLIQAMLLTPPLEPPAYIEVPTAGSPQANDFDRDGVTDRIEKDLLERWNPEFKRHDNSQQFPLSAGEYLDRSELLRYFGTDYFYYIKDKSTPLPKNPNTIYGRVCQPKDFPSDVYCVQYYVLFLENRGLQGVPDINLALPFLGGLTVDSRAGYHEGDILCIDLTVKGSDPKTSKLIAAILHNHGRQFFVEPGAIQMNSSNQPIIYLEERTNEAWPVSGPRGPSGWPARGMVSNDYKSDSHMGIREEYIAAASHRGNGDSFHLPVYNLGEISSHKGNVRDGDGHWEGEAIRSDDRSLDAAVNRELNFLLEDRRRIGRDAYCTAEISFLFWSKCMAPVESPYTLVYNSNAKMWFRSFDMKAQYRTDELPPPLSRVRESAIIENKAKVGKLLTWDCVPYATFYLVTVLDKTTKESTLFIPDENSMTALSPNRYVLQFRHDSFNLWQEGHEYDYKVEIIGPTGLRKELLKR